MASSHPGGGNEGDVYVVESTPECWDRLGPPVPTVSSACSWSGLAIIVLWGSMLGPVVSVGARLEELDRVLATASRMAFSLERFTSTEGSLVLGGLSPARLHILRSLVHYLFRYKRAELIWDLPSSVHQSYVTPVEIGRAWFRRAVLARSLVDTLRLRPRLVLDHIDTALRAEWRQRWHAADTRRFLHDQFEDAGEAWMPEDIARYRWPEMV